MGRVFLGRDRLLTRNVAVKVLLRDNARSVALERFRREARIAGSLGHPNIVAVFDVGEHEGQPFLVEEFLRGRPLSTIIKEGPLPPQRAADLAVQLLRGLAEAHRAGIIHRDLKPENLFLLDTGILKILDFGIAKRLPTVTLPEDQAADSLTEAGVVLGTWNYMAPEQVRAGPVDARSDLFAVGVVLFEMLTGQQPFKRSSSLATASAVLNDPLPPLPASVPLRLRHAIERCTEKDPAQRYQGAEELLQTLSTLSATTPEWDPSTRRTLLVGGVAVGLGVVGVALLGRGPPASRPGPTSRLEGRAMQGSRSPEALDAYRDGERAYRRGDEDAAEIAFRRALEFDPQFAHAAYRLAVSLRFTDKPGEVRDSINRALRTSASLEPVDRRLLGAFESSTAGRFAEAESIYRELLASSPEEAEAWTRLGDLLLHAAPYRGGSPDDASDLLNRGLVLESDLANSLSALMDLAHRRGDLALVAALAERHAAAAAPGRPRLPQRWLAAYAAGATNQLAGMLAELQHEPLDLVRETWLRAAWARTLDHALTLARTLAASPSGTHALFGQVCLALTEAAAGRPAAAREAMDKVPGLADTPWLGYYSGWLASLDFLPDPGPPGGPTVHDRVRQALLRLDASHDETVRGLLPYIEGRLALRAGDQPGARNAIERLRLLPPLLAGSLHADLARGLAAHLALSERRTDAAQQELSNMQLTQPLRYAASYAGTVEPLLRAHLASLRGDHGEAVRWLSSATLYHPFEVVLAAPRALRLARAEEARGRTAQAASAYRRFLARWGGAEVALQGEVRHAAERLAEIEGRANEAGPDRER